MKLIRAEAKNFGSYKQLEFNYSSLGLSLISGPTGSGKSTLQDIALWALYGETAKGGNVDEVRSWTAESQPTTVDLWLEGIYVHRSRGIPSQNDLYWQEDGSDTHIRGKDITDTQKLLETRLGVTAAMFVAASYYNEFSPSGSFFTNKAKDRRSLFEQIADLDFPSKISERSSNARKETKKGLSQAETSLAKVTGQLDQARSSLADAARRRDSFDVDEKIRASQFANSKSRFEEEKDRKIKEFEIKRHETLLKLKTEHLKGIEKSKAESSCKSCGAFDKDLAATITAHYTAVLHSEASKENPYVNQVFTDEYVITTNPFVSQYDELSNKIDMLEIEKLRLCTQVDSLVKKVTALTKLMDLSITMRSILLENVIKEVETSTNNYLTEYFDGEFKVAFETKDDDLDIQITKNGYEATFKQLSKGQRGLLKLCFCVAVMKAARDKIGTEFNVLMFDEAADGADSHIKTQVYRLFEHLSLQHETILVIDHNEELKSLFSRRFEVSLVNDHSSLEEV